LTAAAHSQFVGMGHCNPHFDKGPPWPICAMR
jgi:hypothetical protein